MTRKSIEETELERRLRALITMRIEMRRTPPISSRDEMIRELHYLDAHRSITTYIDRHTNGAFGLRTITPARAALAKSVLRHKAPLSKAGSLAEMLDADEILTPRDGDVFEEVETGKRYRTHVTWQPVNDPDAFYDQENGWIKAPKLKGLTS